MSILRICSGNNVVGHHHNQSYHTEGPDNSQLRSTWECGQLHLGATDTTWPAYPHTHVLVVIIIIIIIVVVIIIIAIITIITRSQPADFKILRRPWDCRSVLGLVYFLEWSFSAAKAAKEVLDINELVIVNYDRGAEVMWYN